MHGKGHNRACVLVSVLQCCVNTDTSTRAHTGTVLCVRACVRACGEIYVCLCMRACTCVRLSMNGYDSSTFMSISIHVTDGCTQAAHSQRKFRQLPIDSGSVVTPEYRTFLRTTSRV